MALILPALFFILGAPGILNGLSNMFPPFPALMTRRGFRERPDLIPGTEEIVNLRIKGELDEEKYIGKMAQAGLNRETSLQILRGAQTYLSALDYITLWRRGELSDTDVDDNLSKIGLSVDQIKNVKAVTLYYPNPIDIVRFAVRDAYTESTVSAYGLDEDMPESYTVAGRKAGLSDELAKLYWRSHWELPSPTQVYEMLHRGLMTEQEVTDFLRIADYMPYYREKLQAISYNPLTRVDIRRMYATGVIGVGEVLRAYKDLGYDDTNARLLTNFTTKIAEGDETRTPKGDVLKAYKSGLVDRGSAASDLSKLGYNLEAVNNALDLIDDEIKQEVIDLAADAIIDNYTQGLITIDQVRTELTSIGVKSRQMDLVIQRELAQARKRAKTATKSDLDTWYRLGFLTSKTYADRMRKLGYNSEDIAQYTNENEITYIHTDRQKYKYIASVRLYADGILNYSELRTALEVYYTEPSDVDAIVAIATSIYG